MKPILQAILVADHVYTDTVTKKKIVVGIFDRILKRRPRPKSEVVDDAASAGLTVDEFVALL